MNIHLILHDAGFFLDAALTLFLIGFALFKIKNGKAKATLILAYIAVMGFVVSHAIGVSVADPDLSRRILMFNLSDIFIPIFFCHCVFLFLGKEREQHRAISLFYAVGIGLAVFFILNPRLFLLDSVPKMYIPNYYVAGPYYWLMLVFFFTVACYFIYVMWRTYLVSNGIERNRIKYFLIALIFGYAIGSTDFLLIYNIQFDPLWGFLFVPLYTIPFTYAALRYELMDIQLVAKKAFIYALSTGVLAGVLVFLNYLNAQLIQSSPDFPNWASTVILAVVAGAAVSLVWRKLREGDVLKYEFMNVVTHKFRTPLTTIKWSGENIMAAGPESLREDAGRIQVATEKLVELTNLLINLSGTDDKSYAYTFVKTDLGELVDALALECKEKAVAKDIAVAYVPQSVGMISADPQRIKFVFQTLLDNAISYTPEGGTISIGLSSPDPATALVTVSDTGIGLRREDLKRLFNKFYRAENGRRADTEGMGIGLYLSRRIVEKHDGKIWVQSAGEGKGTTFSVSLPLVKG